MTLYICFELRFGTFAIEANSNNIVEQFVWKNSYGNEFEKQFDELELLFLAREVRTRGGLSGSPRTCS